MGMTVEDWERRMSNCTTKSEMDYLLRNKPAGVKTIKSGTKVFVSKNPAQGKPLLDRLMSGKKE